MVLWGFLGQVNSVPLLGVTSGCLLEKKEASIFYYTSGLKICHQSFSSISQTMHMEEHARCFNL